MRLDSIIIFVSDINALKSFYCDSLGFEILEEQANNWLLLNAGQCNIGLHRIGEEFRKSKTLNITALKNTKLCFELDDDIIDLRNRLVNEGIKMRPITSYEGYNYWCCDGEDPEGNVFQLKQQMQNS